jgi:hypothetical protein
MNEVVVVVFFLLIAAGIGYNVFRDVKEKKERESLAASFRKQIAELEAKLKAVVGK